MTGRAVTTGGDRSGVQWRRAAAVVAVAASVLSMRPFPKRICKAEFVSIAGCEVERELL